jgi:hypothetical protein
MDGMGREGKSWEGRGKFWKRGREGKREGVGNYYTYAEIFVEKCR